MATIAQCLSRSVELGGADARRETEVLLCHVLQRDRTYLFTWPDKELSPAQLTSFGELLAARRTGQPVAYLTGRRDFWSLPLGVTAATLIPRPETETLVEWALALALPGAARVVDLGTGSGAIALALAHERPQWQLLATDVSDAALTVARRNAGALSLDRVRFAQGSWFEPLSGSFDLIVSNPPYVAEGDRHLREGDVRFEPSIALTAPDQGLADLRQLIDHAPAYLQPGGWLLLEHGFDQGSQVRGLMREAGYGQVQTRCDLAGLERISGGCLDAG
ncbi:MAG: peptide chain release factor N(5)-glutamine methyltransferase [Pseudomonadota bacterium]